MSTVVGLMATRPRETALKRISVPSVSRQIHLPDALIVVCDQCNLSAKAEGELQALLPQTKVHFLLNSQKSGAAGTWNTGLEFIHHHWPTSYVAILDDDDTWDENHLSTCLAIAQRDGLPDAVISSLRLNKSGQDMPRLPLFSLDIEEFLVGNPGWQGSNTFASIKALAKAGGFTNGLSSCNDRDLAIRMLSLPGIRISFSGQFTATWNLNASADSLSMAGPQKEAALRHFFALHGHRMCPEVRHRFFQRCMDLFGVPVGTFL